MRQSGKTTRSLDGAVQQLFNEGHLLVPTKRQIQEHVSGTSNSFLTGKTFYHDIDWEISVEQEYFLKKLKYRLFTEHPDVVMYDEKTRTFKVR